MSDVGRFGRWLWRRWCRFQDSVGGWPIPYDTLPTRPQTEAEGRGERSNQAQTLAPAGAVSATEKPTPDTPSRGRSVAP